MNHGTPDRQAAISTAKDLTGALNGMKAELRRLSHRGIINRVLIVIVALVAALGIFNSYRVSSVADQAAAASSAANQNRVSSITACRMSNITRAEEVLLWAHLAAVSSPPPHLSARQLAANKAKVAAFLAYTRKVFAPRNCERLYGKS
jgi:hypothetical protein